MSQIKYNYDIQLCKFSNKMYHIDEGLNRICMWGTFYKS